ncbi:MAG: hypothetical protein M3R44_07915 [Candidatus Eremiobacteraeota bacterium]|nr:hypothetical protein [Candidatus Eremiobacteraeota bacterium]
MQTVQHEQTFHELIGAQRIEDRTRAVAGRIVNDRQDLFQSLAVKGDEGADEFFGLIDGTRDRGRGRDLGQQCFDAARGRLCRRFDGR